MSRIPKYAQKLIVVEMFSMFSKFWSVNLGFRALGSRNFWFRKVREVCRIHFHLFWYLYVSMMPSYDRKTGLIGGLGLFKRGLRGFFLEISSGN